MAIVKVIEVLAQSNKGWEDAAREAISEASKSVRNIKSLYVKEMQAVVGENKEVVFRLDAKISFEVEPNGKGNGNGERVESKRVGQRQG